MVTTSAAAKIPTSEVDHGNDSATRIATTSTVVIQAAGLRHAGVAAVEFPAIAVTPDLLWRD
jgi:hypothetical protein